MLQDIATCELIEELKKRAVVKVFYTEPDSGVSIMAKGETPMAFESPCTVLVVID